ncbi:SpoIIE family protein phosphatase [Streptomyces misionensis]|uniref:SpoIIE family protein phosphatase n=1 Tax=Streptomyces misionensis TaxID=67331 RepID=UPI00369E0AA0
MVGRATSDRAEPGDSFADDDAVAVAAPDGALSAWSPGAQRLLGHSAAEAVGRPATELLASALPDSARESLAARRPWTGPAVLRDRDGAPVECRLRIRPLTTAEGGAGWFLEAGRPQVPATAPEPASAAGPAAPRRQEEAVRTEDQLLRWAFYQSPFALAIHDTEGRFLLLNAPMEQQMKATESDLRGRLIADHLTDPAFEPSGRAVERVAATGVPERFETHARVPGEQYAHAWIVHVFPLKDPDGAVRGVYLSALDFSEQSVSRERLALLNEASRRIGSSLDVIRTAQEMTEVSVPGAADFVSVELLDAVLQGDEPAPLPLDGPMELRRTAVRSATPTVVTVGDLVRYPEISPLARCLATGRGCAYRVTDPEVAHWLAQDPGRATWVRRNHPHSMIAVPLRARGVNLGAALFTRNDPALPPYGEGDLRVAEELAARAAVAIDNARRYTRERTTTLALQHSLLPQGIPDQAAVTVAGRYLPAVSRAGVGGDWYDVIPLSGARVALVVGDVVGHGLHASAAMGRLRTAVRTLADVDLPPDELLAQLDDLVIRLSTGLETGGEPPTADLGATCLYTVYDPVSRVWSLASAGHPWPALLTPGGTAEFVELPTGPPLGLGGHPFESVEVPLPEGSLLALYTNGLVEGHDRDVDTGLRGLRTALGATLPSLETTCDHILKELLFDRRPADDVALLLARTRALDDQAVAQWDIAADPAAVAETRALATARLRAWGLDELVFVAELVISELVTNAIRYAAPPVQLRLIMDRTLICEVADGSSTAPHLRRARILDEGGRGLMLVAQLTEGWGTRYTGTGKIIWAEMPLPGERAGIAPGRT